VKKIDIIMRPKHSKESHAISKDPWKQKPLK
jgi:hypothetical protein